MNLEYITAKGDILQLTGNSNFKLSNVDGLTAASVELSSSTVASMDGDTINNERTMPRGIIIDLAIEGADVEAKKRYVLKYIKPKQRARLRWIQDEREIEIEGVIESITMPRFTNAVVMQVSMYCSQPYWEDIAFVVQEISEVLNLHYFTNYENDMLYFTDEGMPFGEYDTNRTKVFENDGDVSVGMEIRIIALGNVGNPIIYNSDGAFFGINTTMQAGDEIVISTVKGKKTVTKNGENILGDIMAKSTWLQLEVGENEFTIDSDDGTEGNMYFTVSYKQRYV